MQRVASSCVDWGWVGAAAVLWKLITDYQVAQHEYFRPDEQTLFTGSWEFKAVTTRTGAKYVEAYAGVEDKNGVKVKDWAIQAEPGFVRCSACPGVKLTMLKGKGSLTQRSESQPHSSLLLTCLKHQGKVGTLVKEESLKIKLATLKLHL